MTFNSCIWMSAISDEYKKNSFDYSVMCQVIHEIPANIQPTVISELMRIGRKMVILDSNVPLPWNMVGLVIRFMDATFGRLSFIVLGILWGFHHLAFHFIKRSNMALVWLNIVFLMFVALMPFSTSIRVVPPTTPDLVSTLEYVLNVALAFAMIFIMWTYATGKHRLVDSDISPRLVKMYKLIYIGFLLFFMLVIGICFISLDIGNFLMVIPLVAGIILQLRVSGMLRQSPNDGGQEIE